MWSSVRQFFVTFLLGTALIYRTFLVSLHWISLYRTLHSLCCGTFILGHWWNTLDSGRRGTFYGAYGHRAEDNACCCNPSLSGWIHWADGYFAGQFRGPTTCQCCSQSCQDHFCIWSLCSPTFQEGWLCFRRLKEDADTDINRSREDRVVVSGLPAPAPTVCSHADKKVHYIDVLSWLILLACVDADPVPRVTDVYINLRKGLGQPLVEARFDSVSGAQIICRDGGEQLISLRTHRKN